MMLRLIYSLFLTGSFVRLLVGHQPPPQKYHDSNNNDDSLFQTILQHGGVVATRAEAATTGASSYLFVHARRMGNRSHPNRPRAVVIDRHDRRNNLPLAFSIRRFQTRKRLPPSLLLLEDTNHTPYQHSSTFASSSSSTETPELIGRQMETYGNEDRKEKSGMDAYYLVWSPGLWKKMAMTSVILACLHVLWWYWVRPFWMGRTVVAGVVGTTSSMGSATTTAAATCHHYEHMTFAQQHPVGGRVRLPHLLGMVWQTVVLPMLSSACCAIQLFVWNVLGWGCAGFNTVLGPLRPYLLPLFVYTHTILPLLLLWKDKTTTLQSLLPILRLRPQRPITLLLSWTVAFLPELLHIWNNRNRNNNSNQTRQEPSSTILATATTTTTKQTPLAPPTLSMTRTTIDLLIPSMGCVACIRKIDSTLQEMECVREAQSWLQEGGGGGQASVTFDASSPSEADSMSRELVEAVRRAGFPTCTLQTPH